MPSFFDKSRKLRPVTERFPDVIVDFIFEQGLFFITISNIGTAPAYDVSITFNKGSYEANDSEWVFPELL